MVSLPGWGGCWEHRERLEDLFEWLVEPCLRFVRKNCKELIPTSDINLPFALMNIFESLMDPFRVAEGEEVSMNEKEQRIFVDCAFVFSIVWSIGGTTENAGRKKFDDFFVEVFCFEGSDRCRYSRERAP